MILSYFFLLSIHNGNLWAFIWNNNCFWKKVQRRTKIENKNIPREDDGYLVHCWTSWTQSQNIFINPEFDVSVADSTPSLSSCELFQNKIGSWNPGENVFLRLRFTAWEAQDRYL